MPKIVDRLEMQESIFQACLAEMAGKGYAATTMRDLAKRARCSTGTLYHYFSSKEQLFASMLDYFGSASVSRALLQLEQAADPVAALFSFVESRRNQFQSLLLLSIDYARSPAANSQPDPVKNILQRYRTAIREHVTLGDRERADVLLERLLGKLMLGLMEKIPESEQ